MRKNLESTVAAIYLTSLISGCSDYTLANTSDTGFENPNDENEAIVTYDACDPDEWSIAPSGIERAMCIGIERAALPYTNEIKHNGNNTFTTQLYLGDCNAGFEETNYGLGYSVNLEIDAWYSSEDSNQTANLSFGLSGASCYSKPEPGFVTLSVGVEPNSSSPYEFVVEYDLRLLTDEEQTEYRDNTRTLEERQEILSAIVPLKGIIDCTEAQTVDECTALLYQ